MDRKLLTAFCCIGMLVLGVATAVAAPPPPPPPPTFPPIDLTALGATYLSGVDGTYWKNLNPDQATQPAGTGVYNPFLRLQNSPVETAFNTDGRTNGQAPLDAKSDPNFTHSLTLGSLSKFTMDFGNGSQDYYLFTLDLNEPAGGGKNYLSLDEVKIWTVASGFGGSLQSLADIQADGTLRYNLDGTENQTVYLDYNNSNQGKDSNNGSGMDDMAMYIPASFFAGASNSDFLYFYSGFGETGTVQATNQDFSADVSGDGGFEEWRADVGAPQVPEPSTLTLLGGGLLGLLGVRKARKK